ncbi:MAG TPA: cyclic peptide export ABC transporter [Longimicrobium sp.]|jgi:putative ATP-binding cassette transporter|uniref:cyclic peptide export ABC transporter n=1 Tax=Longimicrobium sp. TaxID=2029185 RepID=UPI002EDA10D5
MRQLMRLASYILGQSRGLRRPRGLLVAMIGTGLASGFAMAAMVGVVNTLITRPEPPSRRLLWVFLALLAVRPLLRFASQAMLMRLIEQAFFTIRQDLCIRILATPMRHLEGIGKSKLMAGLSTDVSQVGSGVAAMPGLVMALSMVVGYTSLLAWLSLPLLPVLVAIIGLGWMSLRWAMKRATALSSAGRQLYDEVSKRNRALLEGTKELKMHSRRRDAFVRELEGVSRAHRREVARADVTLAALASWTEIIFFGAIGVLVFVSPGFVEVGPTVLSSYVLTVLMLRGPIDSINGALPALAQAAVAIRKLDGITADLDRQALDVAPPHDPVPGHAWRGVRLEGVTHTYRRESDDERFLLGPVSLSLAPGELVFIVGANGSGKTTLAKVLLGIYAPEDGRILLDGAPVDDAARDNYRQHFSVVFSDFFLFDSLLGLDTPGLDRSAAGYLETLHLHHKVKVVDGKLSTIDLSQGQRKRLALLAAYLEDRPIYLFDEWAADQDPLFKEVFYQKLLPDLKARGKTVVVISHDDRYYGAADRIVRLDEGRITFDGPAREYLAPRSVPILVAQAADAQPWPA